MKIYSIKTTQKQPYLYQNKFSNAKQPTNGSSYPLPNINTKLAQIYFCGKIPPAGRILESNYLISKYIKEIGKARYLHGDRAVIDLSMGNPDLTPPEKARQALREKVGDLWSHRYNNPKGEGSMMYAVAEWAEKRFGIKINPKTEVMVTSGSSDAVDHIFTAYANYGDKILISDPGYSLYDDLITRHDLKKIPYKICPKNGYLPDFEQMPKDARILILNYPHNPTGSFAPKKTFEDAVKFAKENNMLIIHDMDNSEVTHTGKKPMGILQVEGAKEVAFQVHTMSKAQSMPGFRVAFAISDNDNIDNLLKAKYLSGGSVYTPVQAAAVAALKDEEGYIAKVNKIYRSRKNTCIERLHSLGSDAKATNGTYYLWAKIPKDFTSDEFFKYVLHKAHVAFTPGKVFGKNGEGYVRLVMSADGKNLNRAFDSIENAGIRFDTPKSQLSKELQAEIKQMADGTYSVIPKEDRVYAEYMKTLPRRRDMLLERIQDKDAKFQAFIPKDVKLPWNILMDGQCTYLQNYKEGKPLLGEIQDIPIFSDKSVYETIAAKIKKDWLKNPNPSADILPMYQTSKYYPDANYFVLKAENKIQAIANVELQNDGCLWVRGLNTAPWNQGKAREIRGCGTAIMARIASFCLETGNKTLKLATDKPENIQFYKSLGMKEAGTKSFGGYLNTVLEFNEDEMRLFLNKYQINLTF